MGFPQLTKYSQFRSISVLLINDLALQGDNSEQGLGPMQQAVSTVYKDIKEWSDNYELIGEE